MKYSVAVSNREWKPNDWCEMIWRNLVSNFTSELVMPSECAEYLKQDMSESACWEAENPQCALENWNLGAAAVEQWQVQVKHTVLRALEPKSRNADWIPAEFQKLLKQWKRETAIYSSLSKIVMHPAYQRIMAMGPAVIPHILEELEK